MLKDFRNFQLNGEIVSTGIETWGAKNKSTGKLRGLILRTNNHANKIWDVFYGGVQIEARSDLPTGLSTFRQNNIKVVGPRETENLANCSE